MDDTVSESYLLVQPQDAIFDKTISAGKILKEAFELSWISGYMYCGGKPFQTVGSDRITFRFSPKIGSTLKFKSKIVYSDQTYFRIHSDVFGLENHKQELLSHFNFNFKIPDGNTKQIHPVTYQEGMEFLQAQRQLKASNLI